MSNSNVLNQSAKDKNFLDGNMKEMRMKNGAVIKIFVTQNVDKQTILFVPMIKEVDLVYVPLIKHFINDYRVIVYEPNLSTVKKFGIEDRAKEIISILDTLDILQCNIIAWSDTCSTAYCLGKNYPNRCLSITFVGIADRYILPQPFQLLIAVLSKYPLEKVIPSKISAYFISKCLGGNHISYKWLYDKAKNIPNFTKLLKFSVIPQLIEHSPAKDEMKVLSKIICGDKDFLADPKRSYKMSALLPNSYGVDIIKNAEHFFVYINHEEVAFSINRFLNQIKNK
ncbi:MAG: alpha/beta hydrolase [Saprospiraceae bacterium]|jgi:pimeloyl-ACP methyl ester carboxylesterase